MTVNLSETKPQGAEVFRRAPSELIGSLGNIAANGLLQGPLSDGSHSDVRIFGVQTLPNGDLDYSTAATVKPSPPMQHELEMLDNKVQLNLENAIEEIKSTPTPKAAYSLEMAEHDRPYTHYTQAGAIFQVLRFGLQSGNFKNRLNARRHSDEVVDSIAPMMSGMRFKKGGSYQGADSISLSTYDVRTIRTMDLVFLIDPAITVYGLKPTERDSTSGYGHGIILDKVEGGFDIANPIAYKSEVLAANIIPPSEIRAVIINDRASILHSLRELTRNNVVLYSQAKLKDPIAAKEDLLANCRLFAAISGQAEAGDKVDALAVQVDTLQVNDLLKAVNQLQKNLLQEIVGRDMELSEGTLREAIERIFGISILTAPK